MTSHASADYAGPDAIDLLIHDHHAVDDLFSAYEALDENAAERKRELVDQMIHELSVHSAIEEQLLYPFIRDEVPGGNTLAEAGIHEHQEAKALLADLGASRLLTRCSTRWSRP